MSRTAFYVRRHFASPGEDAQEAEAAGEVKRLYLRRLFRGDGTPLSLSIGQTVVGLLVIIGGAQIFIHAIDDLATRFDVSHLVFALLVAPIATELPEALNSSVIWARRGKDVLALGNITGAMVFQATFPVTIGLLFTPWHLDQPAAVAAAIALLAAARPLPHVRLRGGAQRELLLLQGIFYLGYVVFVSRRGLSPIGRSGWFAVGLGGVCFLLRMPSGLTSAKIESFHAGVEMDDGLCRSNTAVPPGSTAFGTFLRVSARQCTRAARPRRTARWCPCSHARRPSM